MWHLPFILVFLNYIYPTLQSQGFGKGVAYFAFYMWALVVIIPISLTLYRWIEMPGIRVGELLIKITETWRRKQEVVVEVQHTLPTPPAVDTIAPVTSSKVPTYSRRD
jgi:peptidoglycan/LPS O-acetylase OafA/YrhL